MDIYAGGRKWIGFSVLVLIFWVAAAVSLAWGETTISGKVITSDGKLVTSGVVALESQGSGGQISY